MKCIKTNHVCFLNQILSKQTNLKKSNLLKIQNTLYTGWN
jgi:hypothetical protein